MGDFFSPDVSSESMVSTWQGQVQRMLTEAFPGLLSGTKGLMGPRKNVLRDILTGGPTDFEPIEEAAFRRWDRFVEPRIGEAFAGAGATFSTRKGDVVAESLGDMESGLAAMDAQMRQAWRGTQLNAAQQILSERLAPFGLGGSFSTAVSQENIVQPSWGSQILGAGATLGSAGLIGMGGSGGVDKSGGK